MKKTRLKVAKLHEKIANMRKDFLHKLSNRITNENQVIVIEDLRVKNMLKNRKLSKAISEVSWSQIRTFIAYKAVWKGRDLIIAPFHYASSQLCSGCGYKNSEVKNLSLHEWTCPSCHAILGRDLNAARNLVKLTTDEREQIFLLFYQGNSLRAIVKRLERSPSTISRELSRNQQNQTYSPSIAQSKYTERKR